MTTRSTEDYLKNIYLLQIKNKNANTSLLATVLNISPASVSEMVSKLSKRGYIKNIPYKGFKLTADGEKIAVSLVRKHRLIEVFLKNRLNYSWDEVHFEAEKFEHVCSDIFIDKLDEYLGYPKQDPHGDPIPDKNGKLKLTKSLLLTETEQGKNYMVANVNDSNTDMLKYLSDIGIKLKTKINIQKKIKFDNSFIIKVGKMSHLISDKIAKNISVMTMNK